MNPQLTAEQLKALRHVDSCALANAIELFHVRLRNEGFADASVHCLFPQFIPMVGYAATIKIRGASPPTGTSTYCEGTEWWDYVLSLPTPRIVVVQDVSSRPGLGAFLGEVHVNILRALQCVGAVTNGAVRDLSAVEALGFPLFAGNLSVSHSFIHIVEVGAPVAIGGLEIRSGDLLHGDRHGIQTIPQEIAADLPAKAAAIAAREKALIAVCRDPHFSLEKLRAAIQAARA
jgi:regulator of RNase E activity RraA